MTVPQTLMTTDSKFLCGHGLLNAATRGQGVRMSPGLIKPCHFSPRAVIQSLTSAAMVANVLQALTDDSDSMSTTSPDSNFSLDSVEYNLPQYSDSNHSYVTTSKNGGTDAGVPNVMSSEIDNSFGKHSENDTVDEKGLNSLLGEGGDFCLLENPSGGSEGGVGLAKDELFIGDCEIDSELTSKEKTKQWLACPTAFIWKDGRKVGDQEVSGQDIENRDDPDVMLTQDSLSGSPVETPRSSNMDFQDEVEKLANLFTKLEAGSSEEEASGKTFSQKSAKVKGRISRESLRLPKQRASSLSSSLGRKSPASKGLYRASLQSSTGSLDHDSSGSLGQRSAKSLGMRMSAGSLERECFATVNCRSHNSLHPTSLGSSVKSSSSSLTDHLAPSVSEIERRLTDLIGRGEGVGHECVIRPGDNSAGHQATGQALPNRDSDAESGVEKPDDTATSLPHPSGNEHVPKSCLNTDIRKCGGKVHLKRRGSDAVDEVSARSASFEEDSLEKSTTGGSYPHWMRSTETENVTEMRTIDSSSSLKSGTLDCLTRTSMNETSVSTVESPNSMSMESDSLNLKGASSTAARQRHSSSSTAVKHSHIAVRQREPTIKQQQMLFGIGNGQTMDSQASAPISTTRETISVTTSGQKTEYDSDGTWTDDSECRSSCTDHVADSEHEDSDDQRPSQSKLCHHVSNQRFKGMPPETVSGLFCLLDTNVSVNHETTTSTRATPKEKVTGADVTTTGKERVSSSKTRTLSDEPIHDKTEHDNPGDSQTRLKEDTTRHTNAKRVRHATGYNQLKEDVTLTNAEKEPHRKTSEDEQSHLDDIDLDSLTEDMPFVSPTPTNPALARPEERVVCSELAMDDFSQLMVQASEGSHKSDSNLPLFVSPVHSCVMTRSDVTSPFLACSELDKELRSPKPSATQLSESVDVTEEFRSTLDSASIDNIEEGFVTPDEERSLSPDVEDWLFDPDKPVIADVNELNIVDLISLSSRSATPLVSYDADSLGSDLMSPNSQTLGGFGGHGSSNTRVAGFVSPELSKVHVSEEPAPVNLESEPVIDVAPQPHSQSPIEDKSDKELEVTSSDEAEQDLTSEQAPEKRVLDIPRKDRVITPVADMRRSLQNDSVDQTMGNANSQSALPVLRPSSSRDFHNQIFSQVALYSSDDDDVDDGVSSAEPADQPQSRDQHVTQGSRNDAKREPTSPLNELDVNNCSFGDSIAVKDTRSDHSSFGTLHMHSEVSSSEDDISTRTDNVQKYGDLQKEIADVIAPVFPHSSVMSDVLNLAFSRSLQRAVTGCVIAREETSEQAPSVETKEADDIRNSAPDDAQSGPAVIYNGRPGDQSSDTNTNQVFSPHVPVSQNWSDLVEDDSDSRGRLTTLIEQDETSRSSVESSLSVKSSKSSDIDVSETDSDKSMRTKRKTMGAWDADVSSQSDTEVVLLGGSMDSGFISSSIDPGLNVTILGQSECSSQENLCKDSVAVSKRCDHVGKLPLHSYDTPTKQLTDAGNLPPFSDDVGECGKKCTELNNDWMPPLCTDIDAKPFASSDMTSALGKRETNISRPGTSKTLWKLSRPLSLLAVVAEDDAEEKPDTAVSQKHDSTMPGCGVNSVNISSSGTHVPELRMNSNLVSSTPVSALYTSAELSISETNVSTNGSVRHSTAASSMIVESSGNGNEGSSGSSLVAQPASTSLPVTTERKRNPSGIPLLKRAMKSNADSPQRNVAPSKVSQRTGHISTDCKPAVHANEKEVSQKVPHSLQKAVPVVPAVSRDSPQKTNRRPIIRHPSAPLPQSSSIFKSTINSSTGLACSEPIAKKPTAAKCTKSTAKWGIVKQADASRGTVPPSRQRYASAGMVVTPSTRTRIPSAVSLRALSYDRNVQARVDSRFAEYCSPRQVTSSSSVKETINQNRPGKTHSARSASKLNRRINKLSTSKSPSKRLSKSVDSLDRAERSSARVGRVTSEIKATKRNGGNTTSKDVVKIATEEKGETMLTVKLPYVGVAPVMTNVPNDTDKIDTNRSKKEERESNVGGTDNAEAQSKKSAESKPVVKAAISIQTEFRPKNGHKKKQRRRTESSKRNKSKHLEEVSENDIQVTTSESEAVDTELAGASHPKNLAEKPSPRKVDKRSVSVSAKASQKHSAPTAKSPFKITLRCSEQDFNSGPGRSKSPSAGSRDRVSSPGSVGKQVHYDVEMEPSDYETSLNKPTVAQTDEPKKGEPEMTTVDVKQEGGQKGAIEEGATIDKPELVVFGKALKLLQSPGSMKVKSIHVERDSFPSPGRIVRSTDMYIVYASKQLKDKNDCSKKLHNRSPSTDRAAVELAVVKPIPELPEPSRRTPVSTIVDIANIRSETRYSDGQIKRDNTKELTLVDTSSDASVKTKIPGRKKSGCMSRTNQPEVSITRSDEASLMTSHVRSVQCDKFPPPMTKAISDMVISKTENITEDIVYQLCKDMPGAGKQPSGTSPQVLDKYTSKKDIVPDKNVADTDHVETGGLKVEEPLARKRSKKRRSAHSYHSTGSPFPVSSVKSLVQADRQHPISGTSRASLIDSNKSASQPSLTQSSMSPTYPPLVTQSNKSPTCQPSVAQSSPSPLTQTSKSPTRQPSLTQSSRSPIRHPSLTQSRMLPTRHPSWTQSSSSPTCQPSPIKSNMSPAQQFLPQLNDVASRETSTAAKKSHNEDRSEIPQLVQDNYKRSIQMHKESDIYGHNIIAPHIDVDNTKDSVGPLQKLNVRKPRKPDFGNSFSTTVFPTWQEMSKLFDMDNEEVRYDSDSQCCVSQSDIVAILQRYRRMQACVNARKTGEMGERTDPCPLTSNHWDTPEGMNDDKVLDSTLVTAASVIIQTRDIVMQQLTSDGDAVTGDITGVAGTTSTEQNSEKRDYDIKLDSTARAASLHAIKKDAEEMLTCVTKTSNDILNYMSTDKIDVTTHLLRQLQQDGSKESCESISSSNTSLYPTKVEPESWMSLSRRDTSDKHSPHSSDGQKSNKLHKKKHGKKPHSSPLPSRQIKPANALQHPLVKKFLNMSHLSVHIGGEQPDSYISTLHKKTTLKKLMNMKNPRAQVKKLLQKSQENISLSRKDMQVLKQGPSWRSRKLGGMHSKDRGWRANWDDVATLEPTPVIKKKRSCSSTSSIRSRISNLSVTKRRSQSALNSLSKSKTRFPASSDVTKLLQKTRAIIAKEPLCVDLKLLLSDAENVPDDLEASPCSALTISPLPPVTATATAQNNSPVHLSPNSDLTPCKKVSSSENEMTSLRSTVPTPYKDNQYMEIELLSEMSSSYSSATSKAYYSAENEAPTKQTLPTDGKGDVFAARNNTGCQPCLLVAVGQKDTDSKQAESFEHRHIASVDATDICASQSAESNRDIAVKQELSPENKAKSPITQPVKAPTAANSGIDSIDSKSVTHQVVEPKDGLVERMTKQVISHMSKGKKHICPNPKMHSHVNGRRHPSTGSKTSVSVECISRTPKEPLSARSNDSLSVHSLNITPGRHSSTQNLENSLFANLAAGRHSSGCSTQDSVSSYKRDKQIIYPRSTGLVAKPSPVRVDLSSRSASPRGREDTTVKKALQEESKSVTSTVDDLTVKQQETLPSKENTSAFSLSALPKLAINLGTAAIDRLLPLSVRSSKSSDADKTSASVKSVNTAIKSAQDSVNPSPEVVATESGHSKTTTTENSIPKSSAVHTYLQSKCKMQPIAGLKGMKLYPCKDSSASKKASPSGVNRTHKEAAQRPGKHVAPKKPTTNAQLRRSSTTVKKHQPPQKKRQNPQRKPAANEAGLPVTQIAAKKVLSLDSELNVLRNMLNSDFGSSSDSLETLTSSKISTTSVISSTDELSLSEVTTDRSTSPMAGKTTRRMGHAAGHSKKSPIKGSQVTKDRGDRGEPQMRDTTTDPMFSWYYGIPPCTSMPCPTLPYLTRQRDIHQYMSSYPYAASSEIVQSLTELEYFISELSSLVDSKSQYHPTNEPYPSKTKLSAPNSPNADISDSFFDIATFASNLATSFEEISSSASVNSPNKAAWKENVRAKALLNNTHLGRIYLQQMAVREAMDIAKIEETVSDNNDEFSDDQLGTTDYTYSSSSTTTSTSSRASVITPRQNKPHGNTIPGDVTENEHGVKKSEVDHLPRQLANGSSDSHFNNEAPDGSCPAKREQAATSESTHENYMEDTMHSAASEVDLNDSLSFITDSGDELAEVAPLLSNSCVNATILPPQPNHQADTASSSWEMRGIKRKGTMTLEKVPCKDLSPSGFDKPSTPLSQMPPLQQLNQSGGLNLIESCSSLPDTKNRFVLCESSETSSCATHSGPESAATGASKQLSDHDAFNLFFTYLGPEKANAYLEKSASLSLSVKPLSAKEPNKNSAMESMCPSRGSSLLSSNMLPSGFIDDMRDESLYSKPSSHLSPLSLMPSDSILMRDAMRGDRVGLPSTELLKKVEMFYNKQMNGTGNNVDLSQFMQWLHSGSSSGSPAERALHSALRFYQSRPDGDVQPMELSALPSGTTEKSAANKDKQHLSDLRHVMNSALH